MSKLGIKLSKVLLAAAFMILATLIATQHLRLSNHTLLNNGNWTSEKVSLAKTVYGAKSFISRRQALAFGHLDLSAWHGYQEVTLLEDISPEEVRFDFMLSEDAYVVFIWDRNDAGYSGFRFSTHPRFEAIMFRTLIDGEFTEKRPTGVESLVPDQWHRARFVFKSDALDVYLDGEKVFRSPRNTGGNIEVGFRGGLRPALIDNIEIMGVDGKLLRENFSNTSPMLQPAMTALAIVLGLSGAVYLLVRRTANTHQAFLSVVLLNIVLLVVGATFYVYRYLGGALYPTIDLFMQEEELRWKTREAEIINDRIQQEFGSPQNFPEYRILFIGSSQTWGAGALRPEDTIPNVLERSLNRNSEIPVRCINGGISSIALCATTRSLSHSVAEVGCRCRSHKSLQ